MLNQDEERCLAAVRKTLEFYNKKWDENTRQFWRYYLRQIRNPELFLDALRQYPATGKFAPKPADITAIIEEIRPPKSTVKEAELIDDCPPEIRMAWIHWLPKFWGTELPFKAERPQPTEEQEEARQQHIVQYQK